MNQLKKRKSFFRKSSKRRKNKIQPKQTSPNQQYGFIKSEKEQKPEDLLKINARLEKWKIMIKDFDGTLKKIFQN